MRNVVPAVAQDAAPAAPVAGAAAASAAGPPGGAASHRTSVTERGSFAVAQCVCGWNGPARRSRPRARRDAQEHTGEV